MNVKENILEMIANAEISTTDNLEETIYMIDDIKISGDFSCGIRGTDHNVLLNEGIFWEDIINEGVVIVPETQTYISNNTITELEDIHYSRLPLDNNHIVGFKQSTKDNDFYADFKETYNSYFNNNFGNEPIKENVEDKNYLISENDSLYKNDSFYLFEYDIEVLYNPIKEIQTTIVKNNYIEFISKESISIEKQTDNLDYMGYESFICSISDIDKITQLIICERYNLNKDTLNLPLTAEIEFDYENINEITINDIEDELQEEMLVNGLIASIEFFDELETEAESEQELRME